eukprot:TRINITY_DN1676_c0_g1_i6.p1 TRINITY_DN1676_c0_g1~~TRINITY_DN1676_c0_g1_i6.p1  ORF type:complete len:533 (-),score=87.62 TRINITY_DN1676_c0_g1_i6:36-1634(-)
MSARRRDSQEGIVRRQREDAQLRSYQSTDYEKAPVPVKMGWTAGSYTDDGAVPSSPSSRKPPTPRKDLIPPRSPSSNSSRPSSASNVSAHSQQTAQSTQERRPTSAMAQAQQLLINRPTSARDSRNAPSASYGGPQLSLAAVRKMPKDLCKEILIYMLENDHDLMNMVREFFVSAEQDDTPLDDLEQEQIPIVRPSSAASATQRPRSARPATPEAAGVLSSHHRTAPARVPTLPIPDFQAEAYRLANEQYSSRGTERSSTKYDSTPEQLVSRKKTRDTKAQPARSYEDPYADGAEAVVPQIKAPPQERRRRDTGISSPTTPDYDGHHISNPPEYRDKSLPRDGYPTSRPLMTEYDDAVSAPSTPNGRQPYVLTQELLAASLVQSRDFEYKQECPHCSRLFAEHRLQVHIKVCRSAIARPRSPFDVSTQRLEGEAAHIYKKAVAAAKASDAAVPKKRKRESKWRKDREEFLSAVYLAKSMALSGADVANQIKEALGQEQDVFVECPVRAPFLFSSSFFFFSQFIFIYSLYVSF